MDSRNSTYDDAPERYDQMRACWLNRRRLAFITDFLKRHPGKGPVLELGSGTGALLHALGSAFPERSFHGLEPLSAYVQFSGDRGDTENVTIHEGLAEHADEVLPETYSVILSNDVLHHLESEPEALRALSGCVDVGTRWLAIEPNPLNLYAFLGQSLKPGERNFRPRRFCRLAASQGWQLRRRGTLFLIPPFVRNAPRWMQGLERLLERLPLLGGGVWLELEKQA